MSARIHCPVEAERRELRAALDAPLRRSLGEGARLHRASPSAALFALVPFVWMISTSLKTPGQLFEFPPEWIPNPVAWRTIADAWNALPFGAMVLNSVFVTALAMFGELGQRGARGLRLRPLPVPLPERAVPPDAEHDDAALGRDPHPELPDLEAVGRINTFDPLTVGALFAWGPFYIFLLRQFFLGVSREIEEAAIVDGANAIQVLWHVMLPLVKPVLLAVAVLSFQGNWNNFRAP